MGEKIKSYFRRLSESLVEYGRRLWKNKNKKLFSEVKRKPRRVWQEIMEE